MATRVSTSAGDFTAAGTWSGVSAGSGANQLPSGVGKDWYNYYTQIGSSGYTWSPAFTIPNGEVVLGVILPLKTWDASPAGTVTVCLSVDGSAETVTVTYNITDLSPNDHYYDYPWIFCKFASSHTGTGVATYKLGLKTNVAGNGKAGIYRTSTTADYYRIFVVDGAVSAPAANDVIWIVGDGPCVGGTQRTVVMDNTATTSFGQLWVVSRGVLSWKTSVAGDYLLRTNGGVYVDPDGQLLQGTAANPIPVGSSGWLELDLSSDAGKLIEVAGTHRIKGSPRTAGKDVVHCQLSSAAAAADDHLHVDTDTGWKSGDVIVVAETDGNESHGETKTLTTDASASVLTFTGSGLTYAHACASPVIADVILLNRNAGIRSTNSSYRCSYRVRGRAPVVDWSHAELQYFGHATYYAFDVYDSNYAALGSVTMQYCSFRNWRSYGFELSVNLASTFAISITDCVGAPWTNNSENQMGIWNATSVTYQRICWICTSGYGGIGFRLSAANASQTIDHLTMVGFDYGVQLTGNGTYPAISNTTSYSNYYYAFGFTAAVTGGPFTSWLGYRTHSSNYGNLYMSSGVWNLTFESWELFGHPLANVFFDSSNQDGLTFKNCSIHGDGTVGTARGLRFNTMYGTWRRMLFDNCTFGSGTTHSTADIGTGLASTYWACIDVEFRDCSFNSATLLESTLWGQLWYRSRIVFDTQTIHKCYSSMGSVEYDGATVHGSDPSEKMSFVTQTSGAVLPLKFEGTPHLVPLNASEAKTIHVFVQKSAGYSGSAPRLVQKANPAMGLDSDIVVDTLSVGSGTWEELTGSLSVLPANGALELIVDGDGNAGNVYVASWSVT